MTSLYNCRELLAWLSTRSARLSRGTSYSLGYTFYCYFHRELRLRYSEISREPGLRVEYRKNRKEKRKIETGGLLIARSGSF